MIDYQVNEERRQDMIDSGKILELYVLTQVYEKGYFETHSDETETALYLQLERGFIKKSDKSQLFSFADKVDDAYHVTEKGRQFLKKLCALKELDC